MTVREMRNMLGLSQDGFARKYNIPKRTVQNWEGDVNKCPDYVHDLLERCVMEDIRCTTKET